jgi:4-aminobutyrate aminotransferase-like enzyme
MCGLARHGRGGIFMSSSRDLGIYDLIDAVTFGKAIAGGCGDLLSGVAVKSGARQLAMTNRTVLQVHTYVGASARALSIASEVLKALPSNEIHLKDAEKIVGDILTEMAAESNGTLKVQGQGLLWGVVYDSRDGQERSRASEMFTKHCDRLNVQAYTVGDGFMITPPLDAALCGGDLTEAMQKVKEAALCTVAEMGWRETPPSEPLRMAIVF